MTTKDTVYIALFAAIYAVLGALPMIVLPFNPVPITAQSLGPMLAGSILGAKRAAFASLLFIAIALTGFPIMSGGRGGIGLILGPTGGFILGFPISAYSIGFLFEKNWHRLNTTWAFIYILLGGVVILYVIGLLWTSLLFDIPLNKAFLGAIIFIPGDIIKAAIAATTAMVIKRAYPLIKE
ncbi:MULTISPECIES: biotin transporter BioY [unclassified Candidatus Cardinium]|uniref:biotin transporter BioY n=1 Tax=unclassified Candidatus Cardinium TaxID=2641185 RepID=UPI001FB30EFF|nr:MULTISPECIES: biotin transporter BioY [unclassified Candidatus Cardinium]